MAYTEKQARAKAQQIFERFGRLIYLACSASSVEESFLAGFIGVEAGIDRNGVIRPEATRFEPHVFRRLQSVRDGLIARYNGITQSDLAACGDDALRNLATSFGLSQIMGWHLVKNLKGSISELRDPEKHLFFTVQLLILTAGSYLRRRDYSSVLRIWNTGSANGKTYHDDYVEDALKVKKHYEQILRENKNKFTSSIEPTAQIGNYKKPAENPAPVPPSPESVSQSQVQGASAPETPSVQSEETSPESLALPSLGSYIGKAQQTIAGAQVAVGTATSTFDSLQGTINSLNARKDSAKSLWASLGQAVYQALWAVFAFFLGIPKEVWIVVAIIVGAVGFLYLYRQISLGKIREKARLELLELANFLK